MNTYARPLALLLTLTAGPALLAQAAQPDLTLIAANNPAISSSRPEAPATLPDAPSSTVLRASSAPDADFGQTGAQTAPKYAKFIASGETAQPLRPGDKFVLSLHQLYSPLNLAGSLVSAGYSHVTNGAPNYGTNSTAFAQRFGASVARGSSQELFSDGILAPMLHMDPRYYALGHNESVTRRTVYAATRVLVSRTDRGHTTINAPLLLGYAGAAGLSTVYYPPINRNFKDTAAEYGGSLGGAALGFIVSEFTDDLLRAIHIRTK